MRSGARAVPAADGHRPRGGELPHRFRQRDDLPAAAGLPGRHARRGRGRLGDRRGGGGVDRGAAQAGERLALRPGAAAQAAGGGRLRPGGGGPAADRSDLRRLAGAGDPGRRPGGQGAADVAAGRADRRRGRPGDPGPGVRLPPGGGPRRGAGRSPGRVRPAALGGPRPAERLPVGGGPRGAVGGRAGGLGAGATGAAAGVARAGRAGGGTGRLAPAPPEPRPHAPAVLGLPVGPLRLHPGQLVRCVPAAAGGRRRGRARAGAAPLVRAPPGQVAGQHAGRDPLGPLRQAGADRRRVGVLRRGLRRLRPGGAALARVGPVRRLRALLRPDRGRGEGAGGGPGAGGPARRGLRLVPPGGRRGSAARVGALRRRVARLGAAGGVRHRGRAGAGGGVGLLGLVGPVGPAGQAAAPSSR